MGHSFLHQQVAASLRSTEDPSRLQIIVAPTSGAALSLRTAAARMGVPLVNVEAVTVPGLALHVWRSMRPFDAGRLASRDLMTLVLADRLNTFPSNEAEVYRTSLTRVTSGIVSDRMAGRDAVWARDAARSSVQRIYAALFEAYETYLDAEGLVDMADVHMQADLLVPDFCRERDLDAILICSETPVLPAQQPMLEALGKAARKRVLIGSSQLVSDLEGSWAQNVLQGWSFADPGSPEMDWDGPVIEAATRREEVWAVLSDLIERGIPFDDVEIIVSSRETYVPLIESTCRRLQIPLTLDSGHEDELHSFRVAVSDYLKWVASGYASHHLIDLLRNPVFRLPDDAPLSPHRLATLMGHFRIKPSMLSRPDMEVILEEGAKRERIPMREVHHLITWLHSFRRCIPDSLISPSAFSDLLGRWAREYTTVPPIGAAAQRYLERLLEALEYATTVRVDSAWLASFLLENINSQTVTQDFGNGLHIAGWDEAGFGPRSHAYVLGLDDQASGSQPGDDATHVAGHIASRPNGYGRPIPARRRLQDLISKFGNRLTASVPAWDIRASRGLFPGSALVSAAGVVEVRASRRLRRLDNADMERLRPGTQKGSFLNVERGLAGQQKRNGPEWTEYDGKTRASQDTTPLRLSPSRMEQYLACPYRYFLSSVLGLQREPEEGEDWMDRASEGSILHDLFENHSRARAAGSAGVDAQDEDDMLRSLDEALQRQAARSGADPAAFLEARFRELAHGVRRYFERERRLLQARRPLYAEFAFSDHKDADAPPARYQGQEREILLTGRVDRIDENEEGDWVIVDYKTGKPEGFVPQKLLKMDDKLQWALYAWAVQQVSGKNVLASEYVFTSKEGAGWSSTVAAPSEEQVAPLFDSVLKRMNSGHFIPAPDENKTCTWCDFKAVCGDLSQRKASIESKFASSDPDETEAFEGWTVREKSLPSS